MKHRARYIVMPYTAGAHRVRVTGPHPRSPVSLACCRDAIDLGRASRMAKWVVEVGPGGYKCRVHVTQRSNEPTRHQLRRVMLRSPRSTGWDRGMVNKPNKSQILDHARSQVKAKHVVQCVPALTHVSRWSVHSRGSKSRSEPGHEPLWAGHGLER